MLVMSSCFALLLDLKRFEQDTRTKYLAVDRLGES